VTGPNEIDQTFVGLAPENGLSSKACGGKERARSHGSMIEQALALEHTRLEKITL
jgi:hypothetical protein